MGEKWIPVSLRREVRENAGKNRAKNVTARVQYKMCELIPESQSYFTKSVLDDEYLTIPVLVEFDLMSHFLMSV